MLSFQRILPIVLASVLHPCFCHSLGAFQDTASVARVLFTQELSELSDEELSESLQTLRKYTERLRLELEENENSHLPPPDNSTAEAGTNVAERVSEIRRNIQLLKEFLIELKKDWRAPRPAPSKPQTRERARSQFHPAAQRPRKVVHTACNEIAFLVELKAKYRGFLSFTQQIHLGIEQTL